MPLQIIPIYSALLTFLFIYLSIRVIKQRRLMLVAVGDGGKPSLIRAIAAHNNFAQYVPISLLLMMFLEFKQMSALILHCFGFWLLIARCAHAYGLSQMNENFKFRQFSVGSTFSILLICAILILVKSI